jgi:uncharacterized protein YjbI with pentapeptide repeats
LRDTRLSGARLDGARFEGVNLSRGELDVLDDASARAIMNRCDGCDLAGVSLAGHDLRGHQSPICTPAMAQMLRDYGHANSLGTAQRRRLFL